MSLHKQRWGKRTLLPARLLDLVGHSVSHEPVVWLKALHRLSAVVYECKASALAATVLGSETEDGNHVLLGLVEFGELAAELVLGDIWAVGVEDVTIMIRISACSFGFPVAPWG